MLSDTIRPVPTNRRTEPSTTASERVVTAREPNHVWHADLSTVPTALGFWIPWLPQALPQRWPFCWWVAVAIDHYSRRVMGVAVFLQQPSSKAVQTFLDRAIRSAGKSPDHLINGHGKQFVAKSFKRWCRRKGIRQRFGAIGQYGSIAVIERLMRTLKSEFTRRLVAVPFRRDVIEDEVSTWLAWHNAHRPHEALGTRTPDEVYFGCRPACRSPRFEPRPGWSLRSRCTGPHALIRGRPGVRVDLEVTYFSGRKHLPLVTLRRAA